MEIMEGLQPLFTTGIFFIAFLSLLGLIFRILLNPVKETQVLTHQRLDKVEFRLDKLESRFGRLESKFDHLANKVDQFLSTNKT